MFSENSKAYSVYLLFRFVCSLAVSMSTVLSIVYHLEVVQLDAFQLVLVGTVLETSCFLFEIPTGVVADLYSRRRSVLIGMFLYGLGFLMEGALPWFAPVLLAQVVWGCGDTFITGALEAWIASEEEDKPIDKVFLRGSQMGQIGGVLGVVLGTLLGNINLQMPVILGGSLCLLLGLVLVRIMPETNFSPAIEERQGLLKDFVCLFKLNLGFVKGAPVLLALLAITLCGGLASEGFDRLSTAHFLDDTVIPVIGPLNSVTWFGVISLIGNGLGILASQLLIARMEKKGTVSRTSVVMSTSAGYILCLVLFAVGRSFWFMLLVFLLAGLMRTIKEPVLAAWMNDHVDEKMRATVFSTSGQLDSFGQIIGGPIVGLVAQQVSIPWGLVCTAFLLDIMLPGRDGFQICRTIRETKDIPILMVSARQEDIDKIRGLGLGADDYIVKPFSPNELVARVKGHLARYEQLTSREVHRDVLRYGDLEIDESGHRVFVKGKEVALPNKEFELLLFFAKNPGIVFSKETLFDRVWGSEALG